MTTDPLDRPPTADELAVLPKVELHVHLEGSIEAETAKALARRHGEDPEVVLPLVDGAYPPRYDDFMDFVRLYLAVTRQVRTPDDLATVAAAFARQQAEQHVLYTEVTFTALTLVRNGWEPAPMWQALRDGFAEHPEAEIRLIVDAVRDSGAEHGWATVRLVEDADAPVAAFGLAGDERTTAARDFVMLREAADRLGLGLAVHAGETGPAQNVRDALDDLGADRIGHGVAAIRDDALLDRLVRDAVPLEVCPSSNVVLQVAASLDEHPFPELYRRGVNVTVNSDDPPLFATSLTDELAHATRLADLSVQDVLDLQRRAARAAFVTEPGRQRLLSAIDAWAYSAASPPG